MKRTAENKQKLIAQVKTLHEGGMPYKQAFKKVGIQSAQFYSWSRGKRTTVNRPAVLTRTRQPLVLILGDADEISEVLSRYTNR